MKRAAIPLLLTLLCVVPTCASLPSQAVAADGTYVAALPPLPKWAPSIRGPVPVTLVKNLRCNDVAAYGCYHYTPPSIEIDADLPLWKQWRYLRHELVHSAMASAGVKFDDKEEENVVAEAMAEQQIKEMLTRWPR